MNEIGVDKENWEKVVTSANSSVSEISLLSVQELAGTKLNEPPSFFEASHTTLSKSAREMT